jgi:hypothetical protein
MNHVRIAGRNLEKFLPAFLRSKADVFAEPRLAWQAGTK